LPDHSDLRAVTAVNLLGSFALRRGDAGYALPPGTQRLIAFLALQHGTVKRVYVAGMLWTPYSQDAANANLRSALWRLNRLPFPVVDTTSTHLSIAAEIVVDYREMMRISRAMRIEAAGWGPQDLEAVMLAGELLPDWYDDWVVIERESFRQTRLHALETACDVLIGEGRYADAIEVGLAAVATEPSRETAHRAVMRAHLAEGNRGEALRQYELCQRALKAMGLRPSSETNRLRDRCEAAESVTVG
jgi:DNA-binding SARP family transcriptional activator